MHRTKIGSASIEAAIGFSAVLVFISAIVNLMAFYRADILMQRSVDQTCEKLSLVMPLIVTGGDALTTGINALPDSDFLDTTAASVVSGITSLGVGIDGVTGNNIVELILEGTLASSAANDVVSGYIERNGGSDFMAPEYVNVKFDIDDVHYLLNVSVEYEIQTLLGPRRRTVYSVVPVYGEFTLFLSPSVSEKTDYDIWGEDNFTRGDYFRSSYGANLPKTFPVIDSFENGTATSVLSVDLTAPTYQSASSITEVITENIDELSSFTGAQKEISGQTYSVSGIISRKLIVVIPENSSDASKLAVKAYTSYAALKGVSLVVEEYGQSTKYSSGDG